MSAPTALTLDGAGEWVHFTLGTILFLLPGLAAADRWMPGRHRWLWSPLWSFTLLVLTGILLDYAFGFPVTEAATIALALLLALWIGRRRVAQAVRALRRGARPRRVAPTKRQLLQAGALAGVLTLVALVAYIPHMPGQANEPAHPYGGLAWRAWDAAQGSDYPYPIHVDEHIHMARIAGMVRQGTVLSDDPYTGEPEPGELLTVAGMRGERGFQLGIAQLHLLTGASLPTLFHFLPAFWSAYLALALFLALRPAPGALAAAAFVAILHTTLRFMGPAFLIPSAFGLPWLLGVLVVAAKGQGPARLAGLSLLITAAFFMHLVDGVLALAVGLATALLLNLPVLQRLALAGTVLLPLLWVWPSAGNDIVAAVSTTSTLPFDRHYFLTPGLLVLGLATVGAFAAWYRMRGRFDPATLPHRVLAVLALALMASLATSIQAGHSNDATYSRLVHFFFLCLAALAGLGAAAPLRLLVSRLARPRWRPLAAGAAVGATVLLALAHPLQAHIDEQYYGVFSPAAWEAAGAFAQTGAGSEDLFLSHPWQAPVYNSVTGARPYAVLLPGAPPVRGEDYVYYMESGGANATWLQERDIDYVVSEQPPNAPHQRLAPGVYRLLPAESAAAVQYF